MFNHAKTAIKRPKITFDMPEIGKLVLSLAPDNGRNAGFIYVKNNGEYQGKISPEGVFSPFNCAETVKEYIKNFSADPAKIAMEYGRATGNCCFCARLLTDARSVTVGYGPICAENYGLPWGS
jgi:hypothetical protein